jgi:hypothetical protein
MAKMCHTKPRVSTPFNTFAIFDVESKGFSEVNPLVPNQSQRPIELYRPRLFLND